MQIKLQTLDTDKNLNHMQTERDDLAVKLQLEGECKIQQIKLLQFSCVKSVLLFIPLALSIIGLFFLKYYKTLRAKVFYCEADRFGASHVYVRGNGKKNEQIIALIRQNSKSYFFFKSLKYELAGDLTHIPVAVNYQAQLRKRFNSTFLANGHSKQEATQKRATYGRNEHIVQAPQYFQYLYQVMSEPFFFIQYLAAVIYFIQKLQSLAILLLGASVITTSINYILLYISYRKIKEIAEQVIQVQVLRQGQFVILPSTDLVPGDIFVLKKEEELTCDVILIQGQVYVNQANLTGESVPIGKFGLQSLSKWQKGDTSRWIYQGSKILSANRPLAMAMHTGYTSKRGRILRKILNKNTTAPHFFTTCMYFLVFNYLIGVILYLGTLNLRLSVTPLQPIIIFLNFLLIITFCFPPASPIYFNLVYSFSLLRLKTKNILGTQPEKTVQAAHLKIMCFDKTGTLTEDKVEVNRVYKFLNQREIDITNKPTNERMIDYKIFGSCHNVKYFQQKFMGDQIDLKMFYHSGYSLYPQCASGSCFEVVTQISSAQIKLKILKLYQYQSRFQSMSVMVYDCQTKKYFVFVKGAPEVIHKKSTTKYNYFDNLLQSVSYGGYRSIAYGYKQINVKDKDKWLNQSRENFLNDIEILGLLVFQNKLKSDSASTISLLAEAGIQSRMITGDNVYIAIQTAIRCGILHRDEQIAVIEGKQQQISNQQSVQNIVINIKVFSFKEQKVKITKNQIQYRAYMNLTRSVVIDNDFLMLQKNTQGFQLTPNIKVYTRISPQNKAFIVKALKQVIAKKRRKMTKLQQLFEVQVDKIGMIGDGANDLLAIKQADIGVGIRNCDSSYAANFSLIELSGLDEIVREAKCAQRIIIEIQRYISITAFLTVPLLIIFQTEYSFFSAFQLIAVNITKSITFPILMCLSRPALKPTKHRPCSNFMKTENQLSHWGNVVIGTLAFAAVVWYYRRTDEYVWNTQVATLDSGWFFQTSLTTCTYLYFNINPVALVIFLYDSDPWKEPIYKNYLLFIWVLLNVGYSGALSFLVAQLKSFFSFISMSYQSMAIIFGIGMGASLLTFIYNQWVSSLKLHERNQSFCNVLKQVQQIEMAERGRTTQNQDRVSQ